MKIPTFLCFLGLLASPLAAKEPASPPANKKRAEAEARKAAVAEQTRRDAEAFKKDREAAEQMASDFQKDPRKPTRENISGRWSHGPGLTGSEFQLEQDGEKVTGRGYDWGCMGTYGTFLITGTYRDGILETVRTPLKGNAMLWKMKFVQENGYPRFKEVKERLPQFIAHYELAETREPAAKK